MAQQVNKNKVLTFRQPTSMPNEDQANPKSSNRMLHPKAKRRRFIWLVSTMMFLIWFGVQLVVQQMKIWDREEILAKKMEELESLRTESQRLDQELQKLDDPVYLLEQAHRMGYGKKNEQNFELGTE